DVPIFKILRYKPCLGFFGYRSRKLIAALKLRIIGMLMPSGVYDRTKAKKSSGHARCIVCNHAERVRIEIECAAARPDRAIAEQFGLKRDAVRRHWQNHVSGARKAELICGPLKIQRLAEK